MTAPVIRPPMIEPLPERPLWKSGLFWMMAILGSVVIISFVANLHRVVQEERRIQETRVHAIGPVGEILAGAPSKALRSFPITEARVKDGDTIALTMDLGFDVLFRQDLRVYGVDTPEKSTPEGKMVIQVAEKWIRSRKELSVTYHKADKFGGRFNGDLYGDGEDFKTFLIQLEVGRPYYGEKKEEWTNEQIEKVRSSATKYLESEVK